MPFNELNQNYKTIKYLLAFVFITFHAYSLIQFNKICIVITSYSYIIMTQVQGTL